MLIIDATTKKFKIHYRGRYLDNEELVNYFKKYWASSGDVMIADERSDIPDRIESNQEKIKTWGPLLRQKVQWESILNRPAVDWIKIKKDQLDYAHQGFDLVFFVDSNKILLKPCWDIPMRKDENGVPYYL